MERKYYPINEETARAAKEINSFTPYKEGEATEEYRHYCDKAYNIFDNIAQKRPQYLERAEAMTDRYCRKLAEYYNDYYRNEASCPSVMISGAGNFPVRKKEKQNARRDTLRSTWEYLQGYLKKIENLLTYDRPIMCGDENAMESLQDKIDGLEKQKELAKDLNKFFRKGGKIEDYDGEITDTLKKEIDFLIRQGYDPCISTANTNAEIRRLNERLDKLRKVKEEGTTEATAADTDGNELFKVIKNTEIMRLQLFFDGKPADEVREILKKNGFKWSPKNGAWQRQLTDNALYSLKRVVEEIKDNLIIKSSQAPFSEGTYAEFNNMQVNQTEESAEEHTSDLAKDRLAGLPEDFVGALADEHTPDWTKDKLAELSEETVESDNIEEQPFIQSM